MQQSLGLQFLPVLSLSYLTPRWSYESNLRLLSHLLPPALPPSLPPSLVSCSESVLELSIMPKDEDVLQLVSADTRPLDSATAERHRIHPTLRFSFRR